MFLYRNYHRKRIDFWLHQGAVPLTTPLSHFRVSDFRLDIALIAPYSKVLGINIVQVSHKYLQKINVCYGLDLVSS